MHLCEYLRQFFSRSAVARREAVRIIAAHARRHQVCLHRPRALAGPEDGGAQRGESHQDEAGEAEAQAQGRRRERRGAAARPPDYILTAKVSDMLLAVPKYGHVKVNKILAQCRISPSKTIGGLSQRQRRSSSVTSSGGNSEDRRGGRLFVITGPSGVGKGTLIDRLLEEVPDLELSVSATTRGPRGSERDGVHYHFMDEEEFERRVADGRVHGARRLCRPPLRDAALRGRAAPGRGPQRGARDRGPGRPPGPRDRPRRRAGVHRAALAGGPARAPRGPGHRQPASRSSAGWRSPREELEARDEFGHVVVNDDVERAVAASSPQLVRSHLAANGRPWRALRSPSG